MGDRWGNLGRVVIATAVLATRPVSAGAQGQVVPPPPPSAAGTSIPVVPGPDYEAGGLHRTFLGDNWRDVWLTAADALVFGIDRFAGGVSPEEQGGGHQSLTLHLKEEDGWREYIFRSVDKYPEQGMPKEIRGTVIGWMVEDMISALFPGAPLLIPPFADAAGLLHVDPILRVMPDDPGLDVYRDTFGGMLGTVEIAPNEAEGDRPGFAGSTNVKSTDEFFDDLESSKAHRLDEREFLTSRLLDFLVNDTDRTRDNMRWARFGEDGDYRWRPLPIDRDWAFIDAEGLVPRVLAKWYPKLVSFGPEFPSVDALGYSSHVLDRRLLQRLTREDFMAVADAVQAAITDDVINAAIAGMPERWQRETDAPSRIREVIRTRRENLRDVAVAFYEKLAGDVDIRGTREPDEAMVERLGDGRVRVRITWPEGGPRSGETFFDRTFLPSETTEVRLYLLDGDDRARVTGMPSSAIAVRIIGGEGKDILSDEAGGGATRLYDDSGNNRFERTSETGISTRAWEPPEPQEGVRVGHSWSPDWGGSAGWKPRVEWVTPAGLVVGAGPFWTSYGFRRLPHRWRASATLLYAIAENSFGAQAHGEYRPENSPLALTLEARGVQFDAFRFDDFGNDTPATGDAGLVSQLRVVIEPSLAWHIGWRNRESGGGLLDDDAGDRKGALRPLMGRLEVGPVFLWTDARPDATSSFALVGAPRSTARGGIRVAFELDRTERDAVPRLGWRLEAGAAAYPDLLGRGGAGFAEADVRASAYVPIPRLDGPHLAFRAGGRVVTDNAPVQHSAWIGGRGNVRGFRWQRYRGDASAFGSAEVRIPVAPVNLLVRWNLGVFGLADAGRVWYDGRSPGGWHAGYGLGVWLSAFDTAISAAYAHGEEGRFYVNLGMSF